MTSAAFVSTAIRKVISAYGDGEEGGQRRTTGMDVLGPLPHLRRLNFHA